MSVRQVVGLALAALLVTWAGTARADKIDGNWCRDGGMRFSIDGPVIVTPGGSRINGSYHRHYFSYVVPPGEPGAGSTVNMALLDPDTVELMPAGSAPSQTWLRCNPDISLLGSPEGRLMWPS